MATGKQILSDFIDCFKIEYIFGNPGTTETTFLDVVANHPNCNYILALHESTATGIAAGYAVKSGKPSILNIHTYPGLANAMCNMFNAYAAGIPMVVIAGQQNRHHLIHQPILFGDLTKLAETATVTQVQIDRVGDMSTLLQRSYLDADEHKAPTFVSIPMEIYEDETTSASFKSTQVFSDASIENLSDIASSIRSTHGKIVFVADAEAAWSHDLKNALRSLSEGLDADVYLAPFALTTVVDIRSPNYKGVLPAISLESNAILSGYGTIVLLGEKIQSFLFKDQPTVPEKPLLIQLSNGRTRIRYDYPTDYVIRGDIAKNLVHLRSALGVSESFKPDSSGNLTVPPSLLSHILEALPRTTPIVIEGSSHQNMEEKITTELRFEEVYFEPRGGALGMAMPLAIGVSLHSKKPIVCLVGDGGSLYSIHSIWTAAHYKIPLVIICFVNHQYQILKQLWHLQIPTSGEIDYKPILDIKDPELDLHGIARGFGAKTHHANLDNYKSLLKEALSHKGPTFITIPDDHRY